MRFRSISSVVPVYNSEQSLEALVARLIPVLSSLAPTFEIILVNDGSGDRSWECIEQIASRCPQIIGIDLMRNYGQHNALLCGIRRASGEIIVTLDDDLQHPPEEIPKLLALLGGDQDVVFGTPHQQQHGFLRDAASEITKLALQGAMGADVARNVSAFRAFKANIREAFSAYQGPFVSIDVLLTWGTSRFGVVQVEHHPRVFGASNYTIGKLIRHAINMMTGFSTLPLQLASLIGFVFTAFGMVLFLFVLGRYILEGGTVPGFPFLASAIAVFSGAQLFALGIIGEYLARMHFRMMDRPPYAARAYTISARADN